MSYFKFQMRSIFAALTIAASALAAIPVIPATVVAQGLPGLTIFSGVDRENQLGYRLDFGGLTSQRDRYRLRIPEKKMTFAVSLFAVTYPDTYEGRFDPEAVEVRVDGESVPVDEVSWDEENRTIEIYPVDPVPADTQVELVLSNVRNPRNVGTHYFNALVRSPGDLPLMRYVGTWILSIDTN
jgi:hypothetical protein